MHQELLRAALFSAITANNFASEIEITGSTIDLPGLNAIQKAAVYKHGLRNLSGQRLALGQAMMVIMWNEYREGLCQFDGEGGAEYNPEDFAEWAKDTLGETENEDYIAQLSYVVSKIFQKVHERCIQGNPYRTALGEFVTVDMLTEKYGLVAKLISISSKFENASDADREAMLDAAVTAKGRTSFKEKLDAIGGGPTIRLPYREVIEPDGSVTRLFERLNGEQLSLLDALVGAAGELHFSH